MKNISFYVTKDGKPPLEVANYMRNRWQELAGEHVHWSLNKVEKKRSNNQNSFWWSECIPIIQSAFAERGTVLSASEAHDAVVSGVWKLTTVITLPDGSKQEVRDSSTGLTTTQWEEKIDITRAYFAEFGVIIPFPME